MPKLSATRVGYGDKAGVGSVDKIKGGQSDGTSKAGESRAGKPMTGVQNANTDSVTSASHKQTERPKSGPGGSSSAV